MKPTTKDCTGTSFHDTTIRASLNELIETLGKPHYHSADTTDKTQNEWTFETDDGDVFTVYDWKEYRTYQPNELINWHIGGKNGAITEQAKEEILKKATETTQDCQEDAHEKAVFEGWPGTRAQTTDNPQKDSDLQPKPDTRENTENGDLMAIMTEILMQAAHHYDSRLYELAKQARIILTKQAIEHERYRNALIYIRAIASDEERTAEDRAHTAYTEAAEALREDA